LGVTIANFLLLLREYIACCTHGESFVSIKDWGQSQ